MIFLTNCSAPERAKIVDIYTSGEPKELEIYEGKHPNIELVRRMFLSSYGDTVIVININDNDTIIHKMEKFLIIERHKNDSSKLVHKMIINGLNETLAEIQYLDSTMLAPEHNQ